jgi:type IV pilus assembly protein PilQ
LLVAGTVVLAGVPGSPEGSVPVAGQAGSVSTLKGAAFLPGPDKGEMLKLAIPGYQGTPRVQVLARPARVVVDLPGVDRGTVSRRSLKGPVGPQVTGWRLAQYSIKPDVTRLVLEVAPGTQAEVASDDSGVSVLLRPGKGAVQVALANAAPVAPLPVQMQAAAPEPLLAAIAENAAPDAVEAPAPVAQAELPAPEPAAAPVVLAASAPAPVAEPPAAIVPASAPVAAAAPAVAPEPAVAAAPAVVAEPAPALAAKAEVAPLVPLPQANAPQNLPALAVKSLLPAAPPAAEPLVPARRDAARSGRILGDTNTRYTGAKMTIDVVGADLTSFLRIIADTAHLNLIVDSDVQGIYTFKFTDTPWDQVLDVILKHAGLGKEISNGIIRVAKVEKLQKEEEDRKRLDDAKALAGDTQSITRPLSFAKAGEAKTIIEKMLTKRGSLIVDDRTNTLIITDLPRNLPLVDDLIAQLDVQIQQVQIEARVVEATKNWQKAFGVQWPTSNSGAKSLTVGGQAAAWGTSNGGSWNSINNRSTSGNSTIFSFSPGETGVTDISGPAGEFWLSFLSSRMSVNVILQALEKEGVVKVVSSPKVVTQNNKKAKVLSGTKIPYPSQQSGSTSGAITVAFADANLSLEVTPQITNDGTIIMDIHVEKSDADFSNEVSGTPTITQKLVETQVLVKDGGTAIMGGVYKNTNSHSSTGVPFLSKLPLIGWLFRNKNDQDANDELLVFITPRILKN